MKRGANLILEQVFHQVQGERASFFSKDVTRSVLSTKYSGSSKVDHDGASFGSFHGCHEDVE